MKTKWYWKTSGENYYLLTVAEKLLCYVIYTNIFICNQHFADTVLRSPENGSAVILHAMPGCIWSV